MFCLGGYFYGYQLFTTRYHLTITGTVRGIIEIMNKDKKKQPTKKQFFDALKQVARKKPSVSAPKKKKSVAK